MLEILKYVDPAQGVMYHHQKLYKYKKDGNQSAGKQSFQRTQGLF